MVHSLLIYLMQDSRAWHQLAACQLCIAPTCHLVEVQYHGSYVKSGPGLQHSCFWYYVQNGGFSAAATKCKRPYTDAQTLGNWLVGTFCNVHLAKMPGWQPHKIACKNVIL